MTSELEAYSTAECSRRPRTLGTSNKKMKYTSTIESVSYLTDMGISSFKSGNQLLSQKYFSQALCRVDLQFLVGQTLSPRCPVSYYFNLGDHSTNQAFNKQESSNSNLDHVFDEGMYVYKDPLHVDQADSADTISSVLFYNIAQTLCAIEQYELARRCFDQSLNKLKAESILMVKILHNLGHCNYKLGRDVDAWAFYQKAYSLADHVGMSGHDIAAFLNCIAVLNFHKDNHDATIMESLQKSLECYRADSVDESTDIATVLNNIGRIHYLRKEYADATKSYEEALQIRRKFLGNDSLDVAATLYNLGQSYHQIRLHEKSITCYEGFLTISQTHFGLISRFAALAYKGIADVHYERSDLKVALQFFEKALDIHVSTEGRFSREVCSTLNKLGNIAFELEDYDAALSYYKKGLEREMELYPPNHPHIIVTLTNLAHLHKTLGHYHEALAAFSHVHDMLTKRSDANSLKTAEILSYIALMHFQTKNFEGALDCFQQSLQMYRQVHQEEDHLDIASSLNYIGLVLFKQQVFGTAKECFYESLRIRRSVLGPDHRDVATLWYNLATLLFETGESDLAIKYYKETLRIEQVVLGADHSEVVASMQRIGQVLHGVGRVDEALNYFLKVLAIERNREKPNDRIMIKILNLMGNFYLQQGNTSEMMKCFVEASRIYEGCPEVNRESLIIMGYNLYGLSKVYPACAAVA